MTFLDTATFKLLCEVTSYKICISAYDTLVSVFGTTNGTRANTKAT
ncbi:hypothetical protein PsAD2_01505 [Pseudovibrio axinellae]|uniref:Uncharacterized protein n=1 Tax=Pseudovibrio axinellae TaxID=989403 RepID=A0A165ZRP7_9HYPH|nr:hypothetical protein PsAD2_01505 [Pseudovibrio axinellae]SEQ61066.1 hypothetical protein SAMN05421798_103226 [Pseudovibrio axinellae]